MNILRCRVCGEVYLGRGKPDNCPFCGANVNYLSDPEDWKPLYEVEELSNTDKELVNQAIELELGNAAFYACAKDKTTDPDIQAVFKALSKIESEHADVDAKFLKEDVPEKPEVECSGEREADLKEASSREQEAIKHYTEFKDKAENPNLKTFFIELIKIEQDHLNLHKKLLSK
ncbi:unnamed protein product [marine sediment metagenome]|uniref:Uncharacterized protein n=1 Tax=marine sediment metagenome TaxID=412755 RepID=X0VJM0_9ZZZZ